MPGRFDAPVGAVTTESTAATGVPWAVIKVAQRHSFRATYSSLVVLRRKAHTSQGPHGATVAGHFLLRVVIEGAQSDRSTNNVQPDNTAREVSRTRHPSTGIHRNANQICYGNKVKAKLVRITVLNCDTTPGHLQDPSGVNSLAATSSSR